MPGQVAQLLRKLYPLRPSSVDAELAEAFVAPAETPGALQVLRQIYTGDPGPRPGLRSLRVVLRRVFGAEFGSEGLGSGLRTPMELCKGSEMPLKAHVGSVLQSTEHENRRNQLRNPINPSFDTSERWISFGSRVHQVLWGDQDTLTPIKGDVGRYFTKLSKERSNVDFEILPGPMDVNLRYHPIDNEYAASPLHETPTIRCSEGRTPSQSRAWILVVSLVPQR